MSVPPALDQLLLDDVRKGQFDWKAMVHALCRIVTREFPSERRVAVGDDTLIPRVSEAAPWRAMRSTIIARKNPIGRTIS